MPQDSIEGVEINAGFAIGGESIAAISQNKLPSISLNVKYPPGIGGTARTEEEEILTIRIDIASNESVKDNFLSSPKAVDIGVGVDFRKKESDASRPTAIDLLTGIEVVDANSIADVVIGEKKADVEADPLINPAVSDQSQSISSSIEPKSSEKLAEKSIAPSVKSEPVVEKLAEKSIEPSVKSEPIVEKLAEKSIEPDVKSEPVVEKLPEKSIEPDVKSEPVVEKLPEKSIAPETKSDAIVEKLAEKSIVPSVKSEPVVGKLAEKSIEPSVKSEPVVGKLAEKSIVPSVKSEPVVEKLVEKSIEPETKSDAVVEKLPEKSIVPSVKSEPVVEKLVEKSIEPETKSEPIVEKLPEKSIAPSVESEPMVEKLPEKSIAPSVKSEPVVGKLPEKSIVPETKSDAIVEKLAEKSIAPEVKSEPIVGKLTEKSIAPEVKSEPVVGKLTEKSIEPEVKSESTVGEKEVLEDLTAESAESAESAEKEAIVNQNVVGSTEILEVEAEVELKVMPVETPAPKLWNLTFNTGVFKVNNPNGLVKFDYLFDGGDYQGELAIFNIKGMNQFSNQEDFIKEAARRATSNSAEGYIVINDLNEGARFSGKVSYEDNYNKGNYRGIKSFAMKSGDKFAVMLVPNGTVQQVWQNPSISGDLRPLFSLGTANPNDEFSLRQIADVTGDGSTFAMEDLRADVWTDRDYNDITFKVTGATAEAPLLAGAIAGDRDWTKTDFGADLVKYAKSEVNFKGDNNTIAKSLSDRVNYSVQRAEILDNYEPETLAQTKQWVVGLTPDKSAADFANLFEAKNLGSTGHIPNTYIWELPANVKPEQVKTRLDNLNGVEFAYPLVAIELKPQFTPNDPLFKQQWNLQNTGQTGGTPGADANVTKAWDTAKGKGVVIGIVDDGLQHTHPDLKDRYRADLSRDFNEITNGVYDKDPTPNPNNPHGTAMAGIAAATGNNNLGISGVAPEASLAGLRLIAEKVNEKVIADALSYLNNEIDIYNNSWKANQAFLALPMAEYQLEMGATKGRDGFGSNFVFGAGNDNQTGSNVNFNNFANSRHAIAVAAIDHNGEQTSYSEEGAPILVSAYSKGRFENFALNDDKAKLSIPDSGQAISNLTFSNVQGKITDLSVRLDIQHNRTSDLDVFLTSPSGTKVELFTDVGGNGRNFTNTLLYDSAQKSITEGIAPFSNSYGFRPEVPLSNFAGENPNGIWKLEINDDETGQIGTLNNWGINISTNGVVTTDLMGADGQSSGNYTYNAGGTSSAAPMVSGEIALMLEANPTLTRRDVQHILVNTAKQNDALDIDWQKNAAGYNINHKYGFGAVDIAAAVAKAKTWTPVGSEIALRSPEMSVNAAITDGSETGIERTIKFDENITVEWAEVMFDATHTFRGDLNVTLISPEGTESILTKTNDDFGDNFSKWVFTSARNWGESSVGDWKLKVSDEVEQETGTWNSWGLNLFGTKPTVSLVATDADATEGEDPGEFTITRTGNTKLPLTVNYAVTGVNNWASPESENGKDYSFLNGTATIPAGQSSLKLPIQTIDDPLSEWPESLVLELKPNSAYEMSPKNRDKVTIWDSETPEVQVFAEWYSEKIGNYQRENYASESGNLADVTFRRVGSLAKDLIVNYSLTGTATPGTDYKAQSGYPPMSGSTVIRAGQHDSGFILEAIDDNLVEGEETAILSITPNANYKVWEGLGSITNTIWDNDDKPTVSIIPTKDTASEYGELGQFTFTRTGSTANPLTVDYWVDPNWWPRAKDGVDFQLLNGQIVLPANLSWLAQDQNKASIVIPAGASSVIVDVKPIDDAITEDKEKVRLLLVENPQYAIASNEGAEVAILDNDTPTFEWKRQSGISTTGYDSSNDIAVDRTGNIYTVGRTSGNLDGTNQGLYDGWISKSNSAGQLIWKRQVGTTAYDTASGVAVDDDGNVYAIGSTDGGLGNTIDRTSWLVKYDANGSQLWKRDLLTPDYDVVNGGIAIANGSIHIVGRAIGNVAGSGEVTTDAFVAKYDSNGNQTWVKPIASPAWDEAKSVASDSAGNIYIAGSTKGNLAGTNAGDVDAWLAKYDSTGNEVWRKQLGTISEDEAFGVAVDKGDRVYLTGHTKNKLGDVFTGDPQQWVGEDNAVVPAVGGGDDYKLGGAYYGSADAWIAQFNAVTGVLNWKRQLGTSDYDSATGVAVDIHGNGYITGRTRGKLGATYSGGDDAWVAKYNVNGALQWKRQLGTVGYDVSNGIAVSSAGVYIGGITSGNIEGNNLGGDDAWIAKLS